jgi:hypothetical protein
MTDSVPYVGVCELLAVGGQVLGITELPDATRAWSSVDGHSWTPSGNLPTGDAAQVAAIGDTLVLVTVTYTPDGTARTDTIHVGTAAD